MAYLVELGAKTRSLALGRCLQHVALEDRGRTCTARGTIQSPAYSVSNTRAAVRSLVERGAKWNPDSTTLNDLRRTLYGIAPEVTVGLVGPSSGTARDKAAIQNLLRTPRRQLHLAGARERLLRLGLTPEGRLRDRTDPTLSPYVLARFDREKLQEEVWAEPTRTVAARSGLSDVYLTRVRQQLRTEAAERVLGQEGSGRGVGRGRSCPKFKKQLNRNRRRAC